jgi:hypothetical protein
MYEVVTLIGSTKIGQEIWDKISRDLTMRGNIVITTEVWDVYDYLHSEEGKNLRFMFDKMMIQKIDVSTRVIVIVKNNRIGESTLEYIKYARRCMLPVDYVEISD